MYSSSVLILIRSIFRVVEYVVPQNSFVSDHEFFLYIFDALLMTGVVYGYVFMPPYGGIFTEWKKRKDTGDHLITRQEAIAMA